VSTGSDNNNQRDNPAMRRIGATKSTIAKIDAKIDPKVICYRQGIEPAARIQSR
jgi:hypothetical protein